MRIGALNTPLFFMAKILAFDISALCTGVAVVNNGRILKSSFEKIEPKAKLCYGERLSLFQDAMKAIIKKHNPDDIVIEEIYKGRNAITFKVLSMFRGVAVKTIFEAIGKDPLNILAVEARSALKIPTKKEGAFDAIITKYKLKLDFKNWNDVIDAVALGLAVHQLVKQGVDEESLRSTRRAKRRKPKRNKKSV